MLFRSGQAAQAYYAKNVKDLTLGEAAMLAGLPKAPSAFNPVVNPKRAALRQKYVLGRMRQLGFIDDAQYKAALAEPIRVKPTPNAYATRADYVSEMGRAAAYEMWGDDAYTRGINVYTTVSSMHQTLAYDAVQADLDAGRAPEVIGLLREVGELRLQREAARGGVSLPLPEQELVETDGGWALEFRQDRKSTRLNSSHRT